MNTDIMNWKRILGVFIGIFALYIGKDMVRLFCFFLGGAIYSSPIYFILLLFYLTYAYMIIGLIRLKKWAWYLFGSTILLASLFIVNLVRESSGININAIFLAIPIVWPWVCITILPLIIVITVVKRIKKKI
jgi:hypothetical protein